MAKGKVVQKMAKGKVVQVIGTVVDMEFPQNELPAMNRGRYGISSE